ncbi:QRFP-like peptide receptor isoform X2 [Portunus trituberculatus]|uniref:QRFP-like peptide receptor isoform X2 n=1 Tax=Portunus trituberculatus TaxID=210409 RepID=UPI001E1D0578|nr:QRFP-like peptide receptor isoform X2 [Portunus trituberculatus]
MKNVKHDTPRRVFGDTGASPQTGTPHSPSPLNHHASFSLAMNASVGAAPTWPAGVTGWNDSMDHTLHDFQLDGAEVSWDNASDGGGSATNESEYDYDYETALDTFFWSQLAPPLAVYAATYVVGVAGNGLIIFTICRFRRLKTTTNVFLASLASADLLLILLCIPVKLARLFSYSWTLGAVMCKTLYFLQALSAICSVLTLTTMSIERYYAIVHPMRAQYRCTISQAKRLCGGLWLLSLVLASPVTVMQVHMEVGQRVRAFWCVRDWDSPRLWRGYETYMMAVVLVVPASVMAAAYTAIGGAIVTMVARRRTITSKGQIADGGSLLNDNTRRRRRDAQDSEVLQVVSMLVVVVLLFILCWSPVLVVNVLKAYSVLPLYSPTLKHIATVADLLSYCNSCVNPFVYGFMSKNFRKSFKQVLCCRRTPPRPPTHLSLTRTSIMRHHSDTSNGRSMPTESSIVYKTTPS